MHLWGVYKDEYPTWNGNYKIGAFIGLWWIRIKWNFILYSFSDLHLYVDMGKNMVLLLLVSAIVIWSVPIYFYSVYFLSSSQLVNYHVVHIW